MSHGSHGKIILVAALKIEAKMKLYTWSLRSKLKQKL